MGRVRKCRGEVSSREGLGNPTPTSWLLAYKGSGKLKIPIYRGGPTYGSSHLILFEDNHSTGLGVCVGV